MNIEESFKPKSDNQKPESQSRRDFLKVVSAGILAAGLSGHSQITEAKPASPEELNKELKYNLELQISQNKRLIEALETITDQELSLINKGEEVKNISEGSSENKGISAMDVVRGVPVVAAAGAAGLLIGTSIGVGINDGDRKIAKTGAILGGTIGGAVGIIASRDIWTRDHEVLGYFLDPYRERKEKVKKEDIIIEINRLKSLISVLEERKSKIRN